MTLDDLFEQYETRILIGASDSTVKQYEVTLRWFTRFLKRTPTIDDLQDVTIAKFMRYRMDSGRKTVTTNLNRRNLLALWRYANRHRIVDTLPDVCRLPEPEQIPIAWTREQLRILFEACQRQPGHIGDIPADLWWHGLHSVMWDTAERISALVSIGLDDLDFADGWLVIKGENRKHRKRDKVHRLHDDTISLLREMQSPPREKLFPWPYCESSLWTSYGDLLRNARLPCDRRHKFHCMRKSVGSYFEAAGGNATELLDHADRKTTRSYLDPRIVKPPQAADVLFRPIKDSPQS